MTTKELQEARTHIMAALNILSRAVQESGPVSGLPHAIAQDIRELNLIQLAIRRSMKNNPRKENTAKMDRIDDYLKQN